MVQFNDAFFLQKKFKAFGYLEKQMMENTSYVKHKSLKGLQS